MHFVILAMFLIAPAPAHAQNKPAPGAGNAARTPVIGRTCVTVEIAGTHAGDLDCAAQQAEAAARIARAQADAIRLLSVPRAGSPDVKVGVSSLSGARLRMGGNLGVSVRPQRPAPVHINPIGAR